MAGAEREAAERPRAGQDGVQHTPVEARLETGAGPRQHPGASVVEQTHHEEEEGDDGGQRHQRCFRARSQHPVVDLQHEQRAGQHQQVDEGTEQPDGDEQAAALGQGGANLRRAGLAATMDRCRCHAATRFRCVCSRHIVYSARREYPL